MNRTKKASTVLFSDKTIQKPPNYESVEDMNLILNFYFQPKFYYGGYNYSQVQIIINNLSRSKSGLEIVNYFMDLFTQLLDLNEQIYFSGCMRNMKINNFQLDFNDLNYVIDYVNVRFDGCPSVESYQLVTHYLDEDNNPIETIQETVAEVYAYDTEFYSFTEYFYRVVAINAQGKSASDWIVVRTPDAVPTYDVNYKYLDAVAISGYHIAVRNMSR